MIKSILILASIFLTVNATASMDYLQVAVVPGYVQMNEQVVAVHNDQMGAQAIIVQGEIAQQIAQISQLDYEQSQQTVILTGPAVTQYIDQLVFLAQEQTDIPVVGQHGAVLLYTENMANWAFNIVGAAIRTNTLITMAASNVVSSVAVGVFESVNLALRAPYVLILNSAPNYGLYYRPLKSFVHVGATLAALPAVIASSAVAATLSHTMGVLGAAICLGPIGWFGACGY